MSLGTRWEEEPDWMRMVSLAVATLREARQYDLAGELAGLLLPVSEAFERGVPT